MHPATSGIDHHASLFKTREIIDVDQLAMAERNDRII